MALTALAVFGTSMAMAHHYGPPAVSLGGELAYVRDFADPTGDMNGTWGMTATYVAFTADTQNATLSDYTSRGRFGDTVIFESIALDHNPLEGAPAFEPVQNHDRGLMSVAGDSAQLLVLNGVNAGFSVVGSDDCDADVVLTAADGNQVTQTAPGAVEVSRDGHTFNLEIVSGEGNLTVDNGTIVAELGQHAALRGWLSGFPATEKVMDWEFDHRGG
jgi:hypothetical protein